ncbi:MAG TPA: 3-oxoacyl-[acyl-carrier-protein] synthase III C-terminal domain-containing protein, partial [Saprospiraceae bacterium]|nr:3-oxoacyl-[acyl-carrier-protein] synthase III C-terminal domain-containing protein [Saprospiraceae bacterium]
VDDWGKRSVFSYKQDVRALGDNIVPFGVKFLKSVLSKRKIDTTEIDYFLPHLSSMFFWKKIVEEFDKEGVDIPESKWFINLPEVGNIGAASAYAMLQGLTERKDLVKGNKVMLFVPESARFSYAVVYLTVC